MAWFVYVRQNGLILPQRFDEWPIVDGNPLEVEEKYELNKRDMNCRLSYLVRKYPYKGDGQLC